MRKAMAIATGVVLVVAIPHPATTGLLIGAAVLGALFLVARLTESPLAVSHAHHDTWFDHPEGELVVRGARRASRSTSFR